MCMLSRVIEIERKERAIMLEKKRELRFEIGPLKKSEFLFLPLLHLLITHNYLVIYRQTLINCE